MEKLHSGRWRHSLIVFFRLFGKRSVLYFTYGLGAWIRHADTENIRQIKYSHRLQMNCHSSYLIEVKSLCKKLIQFNDWLPDRKRTEHGLNWYDDVMVLWTTPCYVCSYVLLLVQRRCITIQFSKTDCVISDSRVFAISTGSCTFAFKMALKFENHTVYIHLSYSHQWTRLHIIQVL